MSLILKVLVSALHFKDDFHLFITILHTLSAFTCSKLTVGTLEQGVKFVQSYVFIVNFEHISQLVLVFLLLTLRR